ncbi:MAG: hypothetical protein Q9227_001634 [Pyrenula ochraceoflavens]
MSCPACFQGVERTDAKPTGRQIELHGLNCYVASTTSGRPAGGIVVIVPDAFGWEFVNNRLLADEYARQGNFEVYLPDFMGGQSCPLWVLDEMDSVTQDFSLMGWLTKPYHVASAVYGFSPFIYRNRLAVSMPRIASFITSLRTEAPTASLPVGVAGFCWGAQHAVRLCWDTAEPWAPKDPPLNSLITAAFIAHPSALTIPADIEKVRKPLCIAAGDKDQVTPIAQIKQAQGVLQNNKINHEVEIYEGAGHGWSVRIDRKNERQKEQAEACERQAVRWFAYAFASSRR